MSAKKAVGATKNETDSSIILVPIVLLQALVMAVGLVGTVGLGLISLLSLLLLIFG